MLVPSKLTRKLTFGLANRNLPHLINLHEDPQLSGVVQYTIESGVIHIGRKTGNPVPQIILAAINIKPNHA